MKKLFLLIGLVVLVSGSVFSDDWDDLMRSIGYYDGDPNQTQILEANKDYVVIRNLTARANLEYDSSGNKRFINAEIFWQEAMYHCSKNSVYNKPDRDGFVLDENTIYHFCTFHPKDLFAKEHSLPKDSDNWSEKDNDHYSSIFMCLDHDVQEWLASKGDGCDKSKYKKAIKKFPKGELVFNLLDERRKKFLEDSNFIYDLKKKVLANANTQQTIDAQQKKMETCEAYGFEKGSEPFGQCIFKLMELELEYAKLENEAMRLQAQAQQAELNNQAALSQSLAAQAQAANRDKGLRLQQFGLAMQGIANAFQTPSSQINPRITCRNVGFEMRCW